MIYIAAAGTGSRLRPAMAEAGFPDMPKHLLPTGEPEQLTLLKRNALAACATSETVAVLTNEENEAAIRAETQDLRCNYTIAKSNNPLGPFSFVDYLDMNETGFSVAGDAFIDTLDWNQFITNHMRSMRPVRFLVGRASVRSEAAVFDIDQHNIITKFRRTAHPEADVLRNIGLYAFTLTPPVAEVLSAYTKCDVGMQDAIVRDLVEQKLIEAQTHTGAFFNVNTIEDFQDMVTFNSRPAFV